MSVAEAVRETIFSEIAATEFPAGAVPIIAIIDTGLTFSSPNPEDQYDQNVRRAIVVRPAAVRIAHAERAPLFRSSVAGFVNSQADDVLRTKEIIDSWIASAEGRGPSGSGSPEATTLRSLLSTVIDQIAFGQVHRLFSGGYFSSNLTLRGELLDFGNMHALPDWSRAQVHSVVEGFGQETVVLQHLVNSLAFHVTKYRRSGNAVEMARDLSDTFKRKYREAWKKYCLTIVQGEAMSHPAQDALFEALWGYYSSQQRRRVKYRFGRPVTDTTNASSGWLHQAIIQPVGASAPEIETVSVVDKVLRQSVSPSQRAIAWHTAARLLLPRVALDRRTLLTETAELTQRIGSLGAPQRIKSYIDRACDAGRRYWRRLPNGHIVLGHVTREGSSALLLRSPPNGVWLEGIISGGGALCLFDERMTEAEGASLGIQKHGMYWSAIIRAEEMQGERYFSVRDRRVRLPPMTVTYETPAQGLLS